jgi:hypothetical protein
MLLHSSDVCGQVHGGLACGVALAMRAGQTPFLCTNMLPGSFDVAIEMCTLIPVVLVSVCGSGLGQADGLVLLCVYDMQAKEGSGSTVVATVALWMVSCMCPCVCLGVF